MGKKRGGRRLNKNIVADMVQSLFQAHPGETLTFKQIFKVGQIINSHPINGIA
jgi:ribonuclease R